MFGPYPWQGETIVDDIQELINRARRWAIDQDEADPIPDITRAIEQADGIDEARLLTARATALQSRDPAVAEADNLAAAAIFAREGRMSDAAACATRAAGMAEIAGDWQRAIQHAVAANVQLADVDLDDDQSVRAATALCAFYGHMAAFELSLPFGRRAVAGLQTANDVPTFGPPFNLGYMAIEAYHAPSTDPDDQATWLEEAREMAAVLCTNDDPVASALLGGGLTAEVLLIDGDVEGATAAIADGVEMVDRATPTFRPWFQFVRASTHLAADELDAAERLLDEAIPHLEATADDHCLLRALHTRSRVREAAGDPTGALIDERRRADLARSWQIERTTRFAHMVAAQAELERDGTILRTQAGELARAAIEDPLTGLWSRRWLNRRLNELEGLDLEGAVLLIDLDHFKTVNDTHGHRVGDQVLTAVAEVLRASFRDGDVVRYGGEEFLVPLITSRDAAFGVAERARMAISHAPFDDIVPDLRLTISVGVASGSMRRIRELIDAADDALYVAKQSGRNRVVGADPLD